MINESLPLCNHTCRRDSNIQSCHPRYPSEPHRTRGMFVAAARQGLHGPPLVKVRTTTATTTSNSITTTRLRQSAGVRLISQNHQCQKRHGGKVRYVVKDHNKLKPDDAYLTPKTEAWYSHQLSRFQRFGSSKPHINPLQRLNPELLSNRVPETLRDDPLLVFNDIQDVPDETISDCLELYISRVQAQT